jgi:hypothetical protein
MWVRTNKLKVKSLHLELYFGIRLMNFYIEFFIKLTFYWIILTIPVYYRISQAT